MLVLSETDVSAILRGLSAEHATQLLDTLCAALAGFTKDKAQSDGPPLIHQPQRTAITTRHNATTLIMPVSNTTAQAVKVVTLPQKGPVKGSVSVFAANGELKGVLNAAEVTAFRTALTTMTLLTRCQNVRVEELVVFGAGKQVEWHLRLALKFLPVGGAGAVRKIAIFNRGAARLLDLERDVLTELRRCFPEVAFQAVAEEGNAAYKQQVRTALKGADAIFCCTPSTTPLFAASDLPPARGKTLFMSLIGSYKPEMQEIDTETLQSAVQIWVDAREECLVEAGELIRAKVEPDELTEVGELFSQGPTAKLIYDETPLIIFKCVGLGLMDLVIGEALLEMGKKLGKGIQVDDF
ncbi:ornithine cyclodeaminase/mu-crystallin family protein [Macrophomina phaseolina]|uniref:Ornithine cyclodeaminase/mu-crystallin family protein n=1 Tax=Macrophomina phaseolina TaxID=35725 RepID=A0ABQ8GAE3_9PEZI|nr:ornithine cyclodeaminase/mu-crystallin family protein [Macrophomina phaseolina]